MVLTQSAVMEGRLIKCLKCGYEFGGDEAEVCHGCNEYICPRCSCCGCRRIGNWSWGNTRIKRKA